MNNVFVYCEIEGTTVAEVSQELLTKGRKLANQLNVELHAIVAGTNIKGKVEDQILPYGVDKLFVFDAPGLFPYTSVPHTDILVNLFKEQQPQIALMGATVIGRDLGPRVSSSLTSGLTADCTQLEIGDHTDAKTGTEYKNLLYQIRPAFGGNIVATIVNPDHRPQMATVRSGVMQKAVYEGACKTCVGQELDIEVHGGPTYLISVVKLSLCKVLRYVDHHVYLLLLDKVQGLRGLALLARPVNESCLYVVVFQIPVGSTRGVEPVSLAAEPLAGFQHLRLFLSVSGGQQDALGRDAVAHAQH